MDDESLFFLVAILGIILFGVLGFLNEIKEKKELARRKEYEEYRERIYHCFTNCKWCGREYQIKKGSEDFCSPKCEHERDKARKN
jgi:hypothetical protein